MGELDDLVDSRGILTPGFGLAGPRFGAFVSLLSHGWDKIYGDWLPQGRVGRIARTPLGDPLLHLEALGIAFAMGAVEEIGLEGAAWRRRSQ